MKKKYVSPKVEIIMFESDESLMAIIGGSGGTDPWDVDPVYETLQDEDGVVIG